MSDITKHEFSDTIAGFTVNKENTNDEIIMLDNESGGWYFFDKGDVLAMAEHFDLIINKDK